MTHQRKGPVRILVVGHDAYRAGAQIELLHILGWLRRNHHARLTLLLKRGGELVDEYRTVLPTHVLPSPAGRGPLQRVLMLVRKGIGRPGDVGRALLRRLDLESTDLIYASSVASIDLALELKLALGCPLICHVHELEMSIRRFCGVESFRRANRHIDAYIAVSKAVAQNLLTSHQIGPDGVHLAYEGILLPSSRQMERLWQAAPATKRASSIPDDAFVVGGCGTLDWRKSPDVFLQVAHLVAKRPKPRPVHFVWVGGNNSGSGLEALHYDMQKLQIVDTVHLVGHQPNPEQYFAFFDAFLLTSREDPFPLVCLEAAAYGVPIICFDGAGGMPEFVEDDAGFVVPYLDTPAAADRILALVESEERRLALGSHAARKVRAAHGIDVVGSRVAAVLDAHL